MHGASIGITTGSSLITRHIARVARHFSIAEDTTEGGRGLGGRGDFEDRWAIVDPIADIRRREEGRESGRARSAALTTAEYREDSRRGGRAVLADSVAAAFAGVVAGSGSAPCGNRGLNERPGREVERVRA